MPRLLFNLLAFTAVLFTASCDKDADDDDTAEAVLYGIWVKGSNPGDTLVFSKKSGTNVMWMNLSMNPQFFAPAEREYRMENGKLQIMLGPGLQAPWHTIESFTWKTPGQQFEILGFHLYMTMSSSITKFTFNKVL